MEFTLAVTPERIWSWGVFLFLVILSVVALGVGSLPDNDPKPRGDLLRWVAWPALVLWLVGAVIRGTQPF